MRSCFVYWLLFSKGKKLLKYDLYNWLGREVALRHIWQVRGQEGIIFSTIIPVKITIDIYLYFYLWEFFLREFIIEVRLNLWPEVSKSIK